MTMQLIIYIFTILIQLKHAESSTVGTVYNHFKVAGSYRSFVLGDWGGLPDFPYRTYIETAVAAQIGKLANKVKVQNIFALGDNFYYDGVKDIGDPRFNSTFEDVFSAASLQNVPWNVVAGNHDWNGNVSAQIMYTNISKRWNFPHYYYNVYLGGEDRRSSVVHVVMIDTIQLCGNTDDFNPRKATSKHSGNEEEILYRVASQGQSETQWRWIEEQLSQSKAAYLLVAGHFPVWSVGEHGPTRCLVERLQPMLYKYRVSAYLCGHDHNLQHLSVSKSNWTVEYLLTGAANFMDASVLHNASVPRGSLKFHWADYMSLGGFGYMEATGEMLSFSFLETKGHLLHRVDIKPRLRGAA